MAGELKILPLGASFAGRVEDVDLARAFGMHELAALRDAWLAHAVLLFRRQLLTPLQQVRFTRLLGEPVVYTRSENALRGQPEVLVLSNVHENGKPTGAAISGRYWHTDGHFLDCPPSGTLLYGKEAPCEGGDTWFVDMRAAYDTLPAATKARIDTLRIVVDRVQSLPYHYPDRPAPPAHQKELWPDKVQPLVRTHPETGRKSLYFGGIVPWRIEGMRPEESEPLMLALQRHAFQPKFTWIHRWKAGDVLLWDNRRVAHKATDYDARKYRRTMHRTTFAGEVPY